mmetsp:Transcript_22803/g.52785  ORF Transcript_22803/g.52785 Transcript_22803/m.52785 type:complete len:217 (+) Transcript_22803:1576-2226(+)
MLRIHASPIFRVVARLGEQSSWDGKESCEQTPGRGAQKPKHLTYSVHPALMRNLFQPLVAPVPLGPNNFHEGFSLYVLFFCLLRDEQLQLSKVLMTYCHHPTLVKHSKSHGLKQKANTPGHHEYEEIHRHLGLHLLRRKAIDKNGCYEAKQQGRLECQILRAVQALDKHVPHVFPERFQAAVPHLHDMMSFGHVFGTHHRPNSQNNIEGHAAQFHY